MRRTPKLPVITFSLGLIAVLLGTMRPETENWVGAAMNEKSVLNIQISKAVPFEPDQVKLTDPYAVNAFQKELAYLKSLNQDRLLSGFRRTAGLERKAPQYGSWESMEIRGHTLGHYLSAVAQAYASEKDPALLEKLNYAVAQLKECQDALGNGYVAAFPESFFDRLEKGQPVWVPWYTMHKILAGLIDVCQYTQNPIALEVTKKLGDWVDRRTAKLSFNQMQDILRVEFGGMNEALYNLAQLTGDSKYAVVAHRFDQKVLFDAMLKNEDILTDMHANTQIPKIVGAIRRYRVTGDLEAKTIAENFWTIVTQTRTYVTGGNSENEHFGPPGALACELTELNNETCNVYNMLKLTRNLFETTGDVKYAHFYERGFLNAIMGSQNPETGMSMYFQPMKTGFFKVFSTPERSFWCCTGTGMENFTKLNDSIYFHNQDTIYVNLYLASTLEWPEKQIRLTQTTNLPVSDTVKFTINRPKSEQTPVGLNLRVPDWVKGEVGIKINGKNVTILPKQGYLAIVRPWVDQDTVELTLPLEVVASRLPDDPDMVAFTYGPLVLCAPLGTKNMESIPTGIDGTVRIPSGDVNTNDTILVKGKPADWLKNLKANLVRTDSAKLEFKLINAQPELVFVPYYSQYEERYGIYWKLVGEKK